MGAIPSVNPELLVRSRAQNHLPLYVKIIYYFREKQHVDPRRGYEDPAQGSQGRECTASLQGVEPHPGGTTPGLHPWIVW